MTPGCDTGTGPVESDGNGGTVTQFGSGTPIITIDQLKLNIRSNKLEYVTSFPIYDIPREGIYISRPNGTKDSNVIRLSDKVRESFQVSDHHLGIGMDYPGSYFAKDMGSKNGTYLLSKARTPQPATGSFSITDKMIVRLGRQWIRFNIHKETPIDIDDMYDDCVPEHLDNQAVRYREPLKR